MTKFKTTLKALLAEFVEIPAGSDCVITGLASDSRNIQKGDAFFAYVGEHVDGRHYIPEALSRGAVAIIAEGDEYRVKTLESNIPYIEIPKLMHVIGKIAAQFFHDPTQKMNVIGITGTNGKTSTSHFIASSLNALQQRCGIIGTLGSGVPDQLISNGFTTPYALELQALFADFHAQHTKAIAIEVSSHALDQGRINGTHFKGAVFTNLTRDHLDYHNDMMHYAAAKRKLFTDYPLEFAVINSDDEFGKELCATLKLARMVSYGLKPSAHKEHVWADQIHLHARGISAAVHTPWGTGELKTQLLGRFNISNLLAALTTLCLLDVPFAEAMACINQQKTVPGRMEVLHHPGQPLIVIDYAHTPDALEKALLSLREHCTQKLWCVFGCGGDRDKGKRPLMAAIAEKYADGVVLTDDNPRHEKSADILADILTGFVSQQPLHIEPNRKRAIQYAITQAEATDIILIAGKGHENYQQIGDEKIDFSDKNCVETFFEGGDHHETHVA